MAERGLVMRRKFCRQKTLNEFRPVIEEYVCRAKELNLQPIELAIQIGGPEVDTCFLQTWEDAEQEIAFSWLRQMERRMN